jgi:hypothetical protein
MTIEEKAARLDSKGRKIGDRVFNASPRKLTDEQAVRMYKAWKQGAYFRDLFNSYGIAESSFWNYVRRVKQGIIKAS